MSGLTSPWRIQVRPHAFADVRSDCMFSSSNAASTRMPPSRGAQAGTVVPRGGRRFPGARGRPARQTDAGGTPALHSPRSTEKPHASAFPS